jgi:hypothetical protein
MAWRSGLIAAGIPLPERLASSWFDAPFEDYARRVAARAERPLPTGFDPGAAEAAGRARARVARQLGVVRAPFRRALELFVALDRAAGLQERGWRVQVSRFCARDGTPRDLLIQATPQ